MHFKKTHFTAPSPPLNGGQLVHIKSKKLGCLHYSIQALILIYVVIWVIVLQKGYQGTDAVVGSAHHTCALWCAAGGIPVGLRTEEGEVYMVLKLESDDHVAGGETILDLQSDTVRADGLVYQRDGIKYLVVQKVLANEGITTLNHDDYGPVPPQSFPEPKK